MWEHRRPTALWASTACYRDSFTLICHFYATRSCPHLPVWPLSTSNIHSAGSVPSFWRFVPWRKLAMRPPIIPSRRTILYGCAPALCLIRPSLLPSWRGCDSVPCSGLVLCPIERYQRPYSKKFQTDKNLCEKGKQNLRGVSLLASPWRNTIVVVIQFL
jgi:hypothetical protein